jgi:hypothetical protein
MWRRWWSGSAIEAYSAEELVAELGSAFLCAEFVFGNATIENHAAYIDHCRRFLSENDRAFVAAASAASKAGRLPSRRGAGGWGAAGGVMVEGGAERLHHSIFFDRRPRDPPVYGWRKSVKPKAAKIPEHFPSASPHLSQNAANFIKCWF